MSGFMCENCGDGFLGSNTRRFCSTECSAAQVGAMDTSWAGMKGGPRDTLAIADVMPEEVESLLRYVEQGQVVWAGRAYGDSLNPDERRALRERLRGVSWLDPRLVKSHVRQVKPKPRTVEQTRQIVHQLVPKREPVREHGLARAYDVDGQPYLYCRRCGQVFDEIGEAADGGHLGLPPRCTQRRFETRGYKRRK